VVVLVDESNTAGTLQLTELLAHTQRITSI
jgi:hypothetical protein